MKWKRASDYWERVSKVSKTTKAFITLGMNCLLLIIAYFASEWLKTAPHTIRLIPQYASYPVFLIGMFLSWWFNKSRVFFCSMTLMLCQLFFLHYAPRGLDNINYSKMIFSMAAVYLPLNILVFSSPKEKSIVSSKGRMKVLFIICELIIGAWIVWYNDTDLLQLFDISIFPDNIGLPPGLPHLSIFLFAAIIIYLFFRQSITGKNYDAPYIGIAMLSFTALFLGRDRDVSIMFLLSGILLSAVAFKASYNMAYTDELTGLPSRRALKEEMEKLSGKFAIAMLDIDHFKKFNDTHGHEVGDDVLKLIAMCIKTAGGGGKAFRYGGEEFTIIFPGKSVEQAMPHLEELREYIANRGFIKRSKKRPKEKPAEIVTRSRAYKKLYLTVSIGVAEKNEARSSPEEVIAAADKALYRAKSKGRNCVCK